MVTPDSPNREPHQPSKDAQGPSKTPSSDAIPNSRSELLDALSRKSNTPELDDLRALSAFLQSTYLESNLLKEADIQEFLGALETLMTISVFGGEDDELLFKKAAQSIRKLVGMIKGGLKRSRSIKRSPKMHHKPSISDTGRISVESLVEGAGSQQNPASLAVELFLRALQQNDSLSSRFFEVEGKAILDIRGPLSSTFRWLLRALEENIDITIESGVSAVAKSYSPEELEWMRNKSYIRSLRGFSRMQIEEGRNAQVRSEQLKQLRKVLEEHSLDSHYEVLIEYINEEFSDILILDNIDKALISITGVDRTISQQITTSLIDPFNRINTQVDKDLVEEEDNLVNIDNLLTLERIINNLDLIDKAKIASRLTVEEFQRKKYTSLNIRDNDGNLVIDGARVSFVMQETGRAVKFGKSNQYFDGELLTKYILPQMRRNGVEDIILFGHRDFKQSQEIAVIPVTDYLLSLTPDHFQQVMNTFLHRVVNRSTIRVSPQEFTFRFYSINSLTEHDEPGLACCDSSSLEWDIRQNKVNNQHFELDFDPAECEGYSLRDCLEKVQ